MYYVKITASTFTTTSLLSYFPGPILETICGKKQFTLIKCPTIKGLFAEYFITVRKTLTYSRLSVSKEISLTSFSWLVISLVKTVTKYHTPRKNQAVVAGIFSQTPKYTPGIFWLRQNLRLGIITSQYYVAIFT